MFIGYIHVRSFLIYVSGHVDLGQALGTNYFPEVLETWRSGVLQRLACSLSVKKRIVWGKGTEECGQRIFHGCMSLRGFELSLQARWVFHPVFREWSRVTAQCCFSFSPYPTFRLYTVILTLCVTLVFVFSLHVVYTLLSSNFSQSVFVTSIFSSKNDYNTKWQIFSSLLLLFLIATGVCQFLLIHSSSVPWIQTQYKTIPVVSLASNLQ